MIVLSFEVMLLILRKGEILVKYATNKHKGKIGKATPVTGRGGPQGCER
jgi:hypothetical protein